MIQVKDLVLTNSEKSEVTSSPINCGGGFDNGLFIEFFLRIKPFSFEIFGWILFPIVHDEKTSLWLIGIHATIFWLFEI